MARCHSATAQHEHSSSPTLRSGGCGEGAACCTPARRRCVGHSPRELCQRSLAHEGAKHFCSTFKTHEDPSHMLHRAQSCRCKDDGDRLGAKGLCCMDICVTWSFSMLTPLGGCCFTMKADCRYVAGLPQIWPCIYDVRALPIMALMYECASHLRGELQMQAHR